MISFAIPVGIFFKVILSLIPYSRSRTHRLSEEFDVLEFNAPDLRLGSCVVEAKYLARSAHLLIEGRHPVGLTVSLPGFSDRHQ